jgi:SAM-dependent methyltransferase
MKKGLCPICTSKNNSFFLKTSSRVLRSCSSCGVIYVWPLPKKAAIKKLYANKYYKLKKEERISGYRDYEEQKRYLTPYFKKKLKQINKLQKERRGNLLDVGCALGHFLEIAKDDGWDVVGLDISSYAVKEIAKKDIKAIANELSKAKFKTGCFDVVTIFQTIEHDSDPGGLLDEIYRILKPGGKLLLTTPDQEGMLPSFLGKRWHGWEIEPHLYWFSRKSLKFVLDKAGFKKTRIEKDTLLWSSLEDISGALKVRYSSFMTRFIFYLVNLLPNRVRQAIVIPQIPLRELLAISIK